MTTVTCPHCRCVQKLDRETIPETGESLCPLCHRRFALPDTSAAPETGSPAQAQPEDDAPRPRLCPICGTQQEQTQSCGHCGVIYARAEAAQDEQEDFYLADTGEPLGAAQEEAPAPILEQLPPAGFWLRAAAAVIDLGFIGLCQLLLGGLLTGLALVATIGADLSPGEWDTLMVPVIVFKVAVYFAYTIFFTGYCGQTPGKMLLQVKVVGYDRREIGFGRAFLRESFGKICSLLLLGAGFWMIAFQGEKRGLHDLMASSTVVKLK